MGRAISADLIKEFSTEVHHVFQPMVDDIKKRVMVKPGVKGKIVQFPVLGKSTTQLRTNFGGSIPTGNQSHNPVECTVQEYTCSEYTDIFLSNQVNYSERQALAYSLSMAMERRMLQLVIDALSAASISNTVAKNASGTDDNLNRLMFKEAHRLISKTGASKRDRTFMAHTNGLSYIANDERVQSSDYNVNRVLTTGEVNTLWGFLPFEVPDMPEEGGLPLSTNDRTNFAFQKMAVGLAINMAPNIDVWWDGDKGYHKITGYLCANAVVIDATGIVKITTDESVV